jgi:hypothetical protein
MMIDPFPEGPLTHEQEIELGWILIDYMMSISSTKETTKENRGVD